MTDRMDALLMEVGREVDWPEIDLVERVGVRIRSAPQTTRRRWLPRFAFATAVVIVLAAGTLIFSPTTRRAVADFLGIGGVRITYGTPTGTPQLGSEFDLGEPVTLAEAVTRVDFGLKTIADPQLGDPEEIYLDPSTPAGPMVAFVYGPRPGLPAAAGKNAAVIFTQFEAALAGEEFFFKKAPLEGTVVQGVEVNDSQGYWLEGEPHFFYYEAPGIGTIDEQVRLVGNVLLWEQDGLTLRLEVGDLSLERALKIATGVT